MSNDEQRVKAALDLIDEMLDHPKRKYKYCQKTIEDMRQWIEDNDHVTDKQWQALHNMYSFGGKGKNG